MTEPEKFLSLAWGDDQHRFRLRLGEMRELQDKCGVGIIEIATRLQGQRWTVDDVRETIRLGLIGGGMKPIDALVLVQRYVDERQDWLTNSLIATAILLASLVGRNKPTGKASTEEAPTTGGSTSPISTAPEPPSVGMPAASTA